MTSPSLFPDQARRRFMAVTGSRYDAMQTRMEKKGLGHLPFSKDTFRDYILRQLGGAYDGAVQCRYCKSWLTIDTLAIDHAMPLHRGGAGDLFNLSLICQPCNARKGKLTPDEYLRLLDFLERETPLARVDILSRLEKSVKLAAGMRRHAMKAKGFVKAKQQVAVQEEF